MKRDSLMIVRGGGDLATGTIHRLWSAGLRVLVLEDDEKALAACGGSMELFLQVLAGGTEAK